MQIDTIYFFRIQLVLQASCLPLCTQLMHDQAPGTNRADSSGELLFLARTFSPFYVVKIEFLCCLLDSVVLPLHCKYFVLHVVQTQPVSAYRCYGSQLQISNGA